MTSAPPGPPAPRLWVDPGPVGPGWAPPVQAVPEVRATTDPPSRGSGPHPWRTTVVWGSLLLAVVLVIALVWSLGGFEQRRDQFTATAPGTTFTSGPYELSFTDATVQYSQEKKSYDVIAVGTGRTTGTTTLAPSTVRPFSYAQDLVSREVQPVYSYAYGTSEDILLRARAFTPGLPAIPFTAEFHFTSEPGDTLRLVVFDQELSDRSIFQDQDPTWNATSTGHELRLPVKRLPDRKY